VSTDLHATYRVQFHTGFGFAEAAAISDYLAANCISGT
jgi:maltooligosyltrehalose synthase